MEKKQRILFEKMYNAQMDKVYRFVFFRVGNNREIAEDLTSEIFLRALEYFDSYDSSKSESAWLMTIAKNCLVDFYKKNKHEISLESVMEDDENSNKVDRILFDSAKENFIKAGLTREITEKLAQLNENDREIVTLHYLFGYNYLEIAQMRGMSETAIKVAAHRALKKIRL
ncbi:MAG TPA: RNA polymerase sigma factor [Candidatus Magasanikbacteria bacterium]|nr:RNA polymerase sigma factor [Candidatus Magasanikbacteria bacterium]